MEIYLMQHGACFSKDVDPEQPLSPVGLEQIEKSAAAVKKFGLEFDLILASSKVRSQQTAKAVAEKTGYPVDKIEVTDKVKAMAPPDQTIEFLRQQGDLGKIFIAGHLPSLAEVASMLLTSGSKARVKFEMGGLCRIDVEALPTDKGVLRFYLTPSQLKLIAGA
ncbi:MAG: histidine phosphatase family protein [Thermodesulfobacteriota bacterium]|nr:histidine phosphatase family protein [Thermodesulfobacteriota bacterium]